MKTRIGRNPLWGNKVPSTKSLDRRHLQGDPVRGVLILSRLARLIRTMESKEPNRPETDRARVPGNWHARFLEGITPVIPVTSIVDHNKHL